MDDKTSVQKAERYYNILDNRKKKMKALTKTVIKTNKLTKDLIPVLMRCDALTPLGECLRLLNTNYMPGKTSFSEEEKIQTFNKIRDEINRLYDELEKRAFLLPNKETEECWKETKKELPPIEEEVLIYSPFGVRKIMSDVFLGKDKNGKYIWKSGNESAEYWCIDHPVFPEKETGWDDYIY